MAGLQAGLQAGLEIGTTALLAVAAPSPSSPALVVRSPSSSALAVRPPPSSALVVRPSSSPALVVRPRPSATSPALSPTVAIITRLVSIGLDIILDSSPNNEPAPAMDPSPVTSTPAKKAVKKPESPVPIKQSYDSFLVLDVEATCEEGGMRSWPNEIIEWGVVLLRWRDKDDEGRAKELYIVDEFRSFVKPTWRPELSDYCKKLTGITQTQVDRAPKFTKVLESFHKFLVRNKLIDPRMDEKLERFIWYDDMKEWRVYGLMTVRCTHGHRDINDYVVKQCFLSEIKMPLWLKDDVLDVQKVVWENYSALQGNLSSPKGNTRNLTIQKQRDLLGLGKSRGKLHRAIYDARNTADIVIELAKRGISLEPNTPIKPNRRCRWMGEPGKVLEDRLPVKTKKI